jgi:hypothetical protein
VLAQVAGVIEADRLEVDVFRRDLRKGGLGQYGSVTSSTEFSAISWMNEMFRYSPEVTGR